MITIETLQQAAEKFGHETHQDQSRLSTRGTPGRLDVPKYLDHYGIKYKIKQNGVETIYCLDKCLFDSSHTQGEAAIIQGAGGSPVYKCFHNSCNGRTWKEADALISGSDPQTQDTTDAEISTTPDAKKKRESKTDRLIKLALSEAELFHDADMKAYATIRRDGHPETYLLRSKSFRTWLSGQVWKESQEGCGGQIVQDALGTLEGYAIHARACHPVHVRLAEKNGRIYLDLGSDRFDVVEITSDGWRVMEDQHIVKFKRPSGMAALPYPKESGSMEALKPFVNLASPTDWPLIVGFILGCFYLSGPFPILAVTGEQGSAKSTLLRIIKTLTDPNTAPLRSTAKELRDLAISAGNSWTLAFDNISYVSGWLSDGLCRLSTGGGFSTRTLYSDDEETIFNAKRPVMLNGIENVVRRHDLADRTIIINMGVIAEDKRIPESEFWPDFSDVAPEILGAILDAVSCALRNVDSVKLQSYPRMADFAKWVTAAEPALGWEYGTFLQSYDDNRREVTSLTLDADLIGTTVKTFMEDHETWEGTATELLDALERLVDERIKKAHGWPKAAHSLSGKIKRSATALRSYGIGIFYLPRTGKQKLIRLEKGGGKSVTSVTDPQNTAQVIDKKVDSTMTLLTDRSVTGASQGHEERHTDGLNDALDDDNDASLLRSVTKAQNEIDIISNTCNGNDANDANDASIPPLFQSDDIREVTL